ncbi:MAG: hypothetical protein Q6354_05820 [Candidatus Brocadiales bacterium]|nr:hypothetical protein [Candidatus Brocadiales bacterium]
MQKQIAMLETDLKTFEDYYDVLCDWLALEPPQKEILFVPTRVKDLPPNIRAGEIERGLKDNDYVEVFPTPLEEAIPPQDPAITKARVQRRKEIQKKRVEPLCGNCLKIYGALRNELGLSYETQELNWRLISTQGDSLLGKIQKVIYAIRDLLARKERELESQETPGAVGEGKPVLTYEKKKGKVKEFFKKHWLVFTIIIGTISAIISIITQIPKIIEWILK